MTDRRRSKKGSATYFTDQVDFLAQGKLKDATDFNTQMANDILERIRPKSGYGSYTLKAQEYAIKLTRKGTVLNRKPLYSTFKYEEIRFIHLFANYPQIIGMVTLGPHDVPTYELISLSSVEKKDQLKELILFVKSNENVLTVDENGNFVRTGAQEADGADVSVFGSSAVEHENNYNGEMHENRHSSEYIDNLQSDYDKSQPETTYETGQETNNVVVSKTKVVSSAPYSHDHQPASPYGPSNFEIADSVEDMYLNPTYRMDSRNGRESNQSGMFEYTTDISRHSSRHRSNSRNRGSRSGSSPTQRRGQSVYSVFEVTSNGSSRKKELCSLGAKYSTVRVRDDSMAYWVDKPLSESSQIIRRSVPNIVRAAAPTNDDDKDEKIIYVTSRTSSLSRFKASQLLETLRSQDGYGDDRWDKSQRSFAVEYVPGTRSRSIRRTDSLKDAADLNREDWECDFQRLARNEDGTTKIDNDGSVYLFVAHQKFSYKKIQSHTEDVSEDEDYNIDQYNRRNSRSRSRDRY